MGSPPENPAAEREQTLTKLRDKKNHFDQLVASVEDYAIFTMDREGVILDWNRGAERMMGYLPQEIIGRHFSIFYPRESLDSDLPGRELVIAGREGRYAEEGWRIRKDGSRLWVSVTITAIRADDGELVGFLKITRDLTERMRATEALRQSEERFRLLLESVQDYAIFMLDPEGHVLSWNSGARRIKGYQPNEILGRHFSVFYTGEARATGVPETILRKALRTGSAEHEGWRVRKDGSLFWGNVVITALHDSKRELRGFAKITRDLTDKKEFLDLQESGRRKDVFLATLAHELRNPLAPMLPALEMMLRSPGDAGVVSSLAEMLQRQVDQMGFLIDDLLDLSRLTSGKITLKKSRGTLADVVRSAVESVQPSMDKRNHRLTVELPDEPLELEADTHRLSQVITNLLSNASRYTPDGGRIFLKASAESFADLKISVSDNGKGIVRGLHARIFDLFDQGTGGAEDGLGIGLTVVKYLVEMHGGSVAVVSEGEGKGSDFILSLPVLVGARRPSQPVAETEQTGKTNRACAKVLIADDGKSAADILAMFFQMEGMQTAVAYNGLEALETAKSFQPDLIIMDIGMPVMDGFEAARAIRAIFPGMVIVALSGWGSDDDRKRSAEAGFDSHLVKPVVPAELRKLIEAHFTAASR